MAKIRSSDDVVIAKVVDDLHNAWIIGICRDETLPLEVLHRMQLQTWNVEPAKAPLHTGGKTVEPKWHPPGAGLQMHNLKLGVAFEHPTHNQRSGSEDITNGKRYCRLRGSQPGQIVI